MAFDPLNFTTILNWLRQDDPQQLDHLWQRADAVRTAQVGPDVHLRGLIEISNYCQRRCGYCGISADHRELTRYRMTREEILACAEEACAYGYGTVVLQAGEDPQLTGPFIAELVSAIKRQFPLAVTLSLGERPQADLAQWRDAGADRYLLRFETSDPQLFARIHPPRPDGPAVSRIDQLVQMRQLGYEIGSGVMVGIPGQSYESLARDIELFGRLDLDMIGVGPYIAHPDTPLGRDAQSLMLEPHRQVPATELMCYKVMALTRLICPQANIPSTTALATLNLDQGRETGLNRGANILMPNLTPVQYRAFYEIYPSKACIRETARQCQLCMSGRIASIGRTIGQGPGGRRRSRVNSPIK